MAVSHRDGLVHVSAYEPAWLPSPTSVASRASFLTQTHVKTNRIAFTSPRRLSHGTQCLTVSLHCRLDTIHLKLHGGQSKPPRRLSWRQFDSLGLSCSLTLTTASPSRLRMPLVGRSS